MKRKQEILYIFHKQYEEYISLKEYSKFLRNKVLNKKILKVIDRDNLQTGSNIARIIFCDREIEGLNLKFKTLRVYTRANLNQMVKDNVLYISKRIWCGLDRENNKCLRKKLSYCGNALKK